MNDHIEPFTGKSTFYAPPSTSLPIHPEIADRIERKTSQRGVRMAGRIRYDPVVTRAQIMKTTVIEYTGGAISVDIRAVWRNVV